MVKKICVHVCYLLNSVLHYFFHIQKRTTVLLLTRCGGGWGFVQLCFSNSWQEYIKIMSIYTSEVTWTPSFRGKSKHKVMFQNAVLSVTLIKAGHVIAMSKELMYRHRRYSQQACWQWIFYWFSLFGHDFTQEPNFKKAPVNFAIFSRNTMK